MATAKKTPVAAKKAATNLIKAKADVAQAKTAALLKPKPVKFKVGQDVVGTSGHGGKTSGRFLRYRETERGTWVDINIAAKGKPAVVKSYRPAAVSAA